SQVTTLARALDQQVGSISHHLRMLERAGVVARVDDPNGDRRTSWWRQARRSFSWSADDFSDSPAEALLAREAERANIQHQLRHLQSWHRARSPKPEWARSAFSTDTLTWATPAELASLSRALQETIDAWRSSIDTANGAERQPVFVFAHGFPTAP